jgi:hypothetical protein
MKPTRINSMLLVNLVLLSTILTAQDDADSELSGRVR